MSVTPHSFFPLASPRNHAFATPFAVVLVLDVVTKRWAEATLALHTPVEVVGAALRWTLTYNTGAAMSLSVGESSRAFFSIVAIGMVAYLLMLLRQAPAQARAVPAALGMLAAGAIGNLIDRLRHDRGVVDFIDVGTASWRFWTFNVADIGVSCGAILLALLLWREDRVAHKLQMSQSPESPDR
ncbi:signal peptidase II [Pseudogemmatithrix spongiicola]|uniref:Lipoprotein signal peptidase n=1 Tax=Pseudogemmatithrix spongiicola TaxID=3062599 RepID=A0AA49JZ32_9BACT|nr:signal peptidase II [Gemmatimonadaceae bacterium 'strain 138']WKW14510.1 signal peptidase II [Gemmatimonadaceae bacterium 'strain 318']